MDGYSGADQQGLIVIGKADYLRGYHEGEADRFYNDWQAENAVDGDRLVCRTPVAVIEAGIVTPVGYEHVAEDIFRIVEQ